jgi:hypothetical protein
MTSDKLTTRINGTQNSYIFVDKLEDNTVWINANVRDGGVRITLSMDQAKEMIAALTRIVEAE